MNAVDYNKWLCKEYKETKSVSILEKYVVSETLTPIGDYQNAVKIVRDNYDRHTSSKLLIIGTYLASEWVSGNNELLEILNQMYEYLPELEKAIVDFLNAHHLRFRDSNYKANVAYEKYLLASLKTSESFVNNRIYLADMHIGKQSKQMLEEALSNITKVYTDEDIKQMSVELLVEPQAFINEHILGTHVSYAYLGVLKEKIRLKG